MKRMLLAATATLACTAAFAAPAQAQDIHLQIDDSVACSKPVVQCAFDLAVWAVEEGRKAVITGGNLVDDVCDIVLGTCNMPTP